MTGEQWASCPQPGSIQPLHPGLTQSMCTWGSPEVDTEPCFIRLHGIPGAAQPRQEEPVPPQLCTATTDCSAKAGGASPTTTLHHHPGLFSRGRGASPTTNLHGHPGAAQPRGRRGQPHHSSAWPPQAAQSRQEGPAPAQQLQTPISTTQLIQKNTLLGGEAEGWCLGGRAGGFP